MQPKTAPKPVTDRACDLCRRVKIKCDGSELISSACSNCQKRSTRCTFNTPIRKRGPRARSRQPSPPIDGRGDDQTATPSSGTAVFGAAAAASLVTVASLDQPSTPGTSFSSGQPPAWLPSASPDGIVQHLTRALESSSGGRTAADLTAQCVSLYLRYLFPITPVVYEASLRAVWSQSFQCGQPPPETHGQSPASHPPSHPSHPSPSVLEAFTPAEWIHTRALTLFIAVCATVSWLLPADLFPEGHLLAGHFLQASRDLLHLYHDHDIERPQASSVTIRYLHALCTHAGGNTRMSWYMMGEAIRLALEMRLYEETSLAGLDPVEAQLRRAVYWQLHTGDRSAAILNERPSALQHLSLDAPLSLRYLGPDDTHLLNKSRACNTIPFQQCLNQGFNLSTRLFSCASTVLLDLRLLHDLSSSRCSGAADLARGQTATIIDGVLEFRVVLDDMPPWLERPWLAELGQDEETAAYQRDALWMQHVNLKLTFHCLRLIMLQRASSLGHAELLGFSGGGGDPRLLDAQRTDIARDFLACVQAAPFQALQLNGEPCVEKIRLVGATLLQLAQAGGEHVAPRAKADFQVLLNVLARLDSKASDAMCRDMQWSGLGPAEEMNADPQVRYM